MIQPAKGLEAFLDAQLEQYEATGVFNGVYARCTYCRCANVDADETKGTAFCHECKANYDEIEYVVSSTIPAELAALWTPARTRQEAA